MHCFTAFVGLILLVVSAAATPANTQDVSDVTSGIRKIGAKLTNVTGNLRSISVIGASLI